MRNHLLTFDMQLLHLSLTNFRVFTRLDMNLPGRILLLVGGNAQGKTTILEAIYYLAAFTSFLTQNDRQLIHFLANHENPVVGRLVADYQKNERKHRMEVRLILEKNHSNEGRFRKEILLDGVRKNAHEVMGHFSAVIFLPQMIQIVDGSPEERRRYLNAAIAQAIPGYSLALSEYNQVLAQRNALLKTLFERRGDTEELNYWDDLLAQKGAYIMKKRTQAVQEIEIHAARIHTSLTNEAEILRLDYHPAFDPGLQENHQYSLPIHNLSNHHGMDEEQIRNRFKEKLAALRNEEILRGVTTIGPHRDDLRFLSNGLDLGDFGSRGQIRTAFLSLKLAEAAWLKEKTGHNPLILLDEIMAELDQQRRKDLLAFVAEQGQALLTTTELDQFSDEFVQANTVWRIENGNVNESLIIGE